MWLGVAAGLLQDVVDEKLPIELQKQVGSTIYESETNAAYLNEWAHIAACTSLFNQRR